jgi:hypothetical protein
MDPPHHFSNHGPFWFLNDISILDNPRPLSLGASDDTKPQRPAHSTARDGEPGWKPDALQWWRTIPLGLTFIAVAISSEVVLYRSKKEEGQLLNNSSVGAMKLIHA